MSATLFQANFSHRPHRPHRPHCPHCPIRRFAVLPLAVCSLLIVGILTVGAPELHAQDSGPRFVDVTSNSGISFRHTTGAFGKKWLPETMGSGVVLFDADGDRKLDILFLNGRNFEGKKGTAKGSSMATQKLYRNKGGLRFEDVSTASGIAAAAPAYCLGGAAGDLDNDGDQDLYLSCLGKDRLLRNEGGKFTDISDKAGISKDYAFGASVVLFDADRDGWLDIYATRYVSWTPEKDLFCTLDGKAKSYCTPESYPGASPRFYRNRGDGNFEDRTVAAGLEKKSAKSLGVAVLDLDGDGWEDLAVANDTQPNLLYRNKGKGVFEEIGIASGMAFSETGVARGGMGIDAVDYDRSGRPSLVIGNFANEMVALYRNEGNQLFVDVAPQSMLGRSTLLNLSFATFYFDYDLDGWYDILVTNGHLDPDIEAVQPRVRYSQPTQLFRNRGRGRYVDATKSAVGDLAIPRVGRGAAWGDLDGDGDPDVVLTANGGLATVLENAGSGHGNWLGLDLRGSASNRNGLGALIKVTTGKESQSWRVRTGGSYLSQSQISPLFGLGPATKADKVVIRWPSGKVQTLTNVAAGKVHEVVEPKGK